MFQIGLEVEFEIALASVDSWDESSNDSFGGDRALLAAVDLAKDGVALC